MTIDKSKLQICCICDKTIEPKYLGKDSEDKHVYWYEGNNALPIHDGRCCDPCNHPNNDPCIRPCHNPNQ